MRGILRVPVTERVVVRNFEGVMAAYDQPQDYRNHDPKTCHDCIAANASKDLQDGVSSLLSGDALTIVPEGYNELHLRGRTEPNTVEELLEISAMPKHGKPEVKEPIWQRVG